MKILNVLTRVYLSPEELDRTLAFYEELFGEKCRRRFKYAGIELASVGKVLLCAGTDEALSPYRNMQTIFVVDSLNDFREKLVRNGTVILNEPQQVPTGMNMIAKHPDGTVIEYVELSKS
ncbi:MAG: VOC family protein [Thermoleophilia bacterium]